MMFFKVVFLYTLCRIMNMNFGCCKGRKINLDFDGGSITSDGGVLLLRSIDKKINLTKKLSKVLNDFRIKNRCKHSVLFMLRQLIYGIALGYEDLNDHNQIRNDILIQTAIDSDKKAASSPTLCRFQNSINKKSLFEMTNILVENFIGSYKKPPKEIILDFDGTDDKVHGKQDRAMFNGYYRHKCFFPLYVFCKNHLLVAYLRPGNVPDSKHSWAILKLLVKKLRSSWPKVDIVFRGDAAFCRHEMFDWCERNNVNYITGIPANSRLIKSAQPYIKESNELFDQTEESQRIFGEFKYTAETWKTKRRIILKAECNIHRLNNRFIVTNLVGTPKYLYEKIYCARGEMENRIKEQQLCLFADRTSNNKWFANQFKLCLVAIAYTLLETIRRTALKGTELAKARCSTIRLKLLKIGGIIICNTRRVVVKLSTSYPWQALFKLTAERLIQL